MSNYEVEVEVTVTYTRTVHVEADSREQAGRQAHDLVEDEWLDGEGPYMASEQGTDYRVRHISPAPRNIHS